MPTGFASHARLSPAVPAPCKAGSLVPPSSAHAFRFFSHLGNVLLLLALSLLLAPHALANPTVPQSGSATFAKTGTDAPATGLTWDIVRSGTSVATSNAAGGWSVSYNATSTQFTVAAPASAPIAASYEVRTSGGPGGPNPMGLLNMPRPLARRYARLCAPQAGGNGVPGGQGAASAYFDVVAGGPVQLNSLSVSPTLVLGGSSSTGTVTLSGGAPAGGAVVTLSSSNAVASVPASVTVAQGQSSATFTISTQSVTSSTSVTISAMYSGTTQTATLTVVPPPTLTTLSLVPAGVTGGSSSTGTVTLSGAAPVNITVSLGNTNSAASVPASVTVYQGQSQGSFSLSTTAVASQTAGTITATLSGVSQSQTFTVYPPQMLVPGGLTLSPTPVVGGQNTTATVTLDGPAPTGGLIVHLTTSNVQFVAVGSSDPTAPIQLLPINLTIPAGQSSVSLVLATAWADYTQSATLTATLGQQSQDATLTLLGANLRLTDVLGPAGLRLHWDGISTQGQGQFLLVRDGVTVATLPGGTSSYDDFFGGNGFTSGQTYTYQLFDTSVAQTAGSQLSSEEVTPYTVASRTTQAVDSRLDLRYSDNHFLDHCFGATTYKGGLFAGMANDPSKVGRSFARVSLPVPGANSGFFRTGGIAAYCTGLQATSATTVSIGCQVIPENTWDFSKLVWTATSPGSFSAGAATVTTAISYDPANPVQQWVGWPMPDTLRSALAQATSNNAPTPLTLAWAAANESTPGWAYFVKGDPIPGPPNSNLVTLPTNGPQATYAYAQPVPIAAYLITTSTAYYFNIILNGLNPGDNAAVTLMDGQNHIWPVNITNLHHVAGPFYYPYGSGSNAPSPYSIWAICNGVRVPIKTVNGTTPGGGGPGDPGGPVFGGGTVGGG